MPRRSSSSPGPSSPTSATGVRSRGIPTAVIVKSVAVLFWARMGSLNALELAAHSSFFHRWIGQSVCSADSIGRVNALMDAEGLRRGIHHIYDRLKRNKALPDHRGIGVAVLDGHESHTSYLQHCAGCLERTVHTGNTDRTQFYHRQVTLMLLPAARSGCEPIRLLLDLEPQRAGEDEVATALRLLTRVIGTYGKHALTVLKDDRRNLSRMRPLCSPQFPRKPVSIATAPVCGGTFRIC